MGDNLTDGAEARSLNWLTGNATTAPVLPLKVRLLSALGNDSTPGTELVNAGGSTYAAQNATFTVATAGVPAQNTADIVFTNLPAVPGGIQGLEVWDSAGTPFRWWWGPVTQPKTTNLGDTARILAGTLILTQQ
jgi:hypothetical protein